MTRVCRDVALYPPLRVPGVYAFINKINGKRYIGSTMCLRTRWRTHLWRLRRGDHHSAYLQSAWNKYGAETFEYVILESMVGATVQDVVACEDYYLKTALPEYNMSPDASNYLAGAGHAKRRPDISAKWYVLTSPKGKVFEVKNLKRFCRDNNLEYKYMSATVRGRQGQHKGWKGHRRDQPFDEYEYHELKLKKLYRDGTVHEFRSLREFAAKHGMTPADVSNVLYGNCKSSHGFTLPPL